ncbi:MAG: Asp/Glu racemase [Roseobacter sp.]|jgi:maleate isomerase/arylmalonate decarboxylase|nr:Asp/Glu racemase [Roseobacter sp.]
MTRTRATKRLGLLVPYTNTNIEPDFAMMCPPDMTVHVARMGGYAQDEVPDAGQMQALGAADLREPLALLAGVRPDVVIYGCTSATLTHGSAFDRHLAEDVASAADAQAVTAAGAIIFALRALGASRIAFSSPYVSDINQMAVDFFAGEGIRTVARADIGAALSNDEQGALTPQDVFEMGQQVDVPEAEVVVLSCTDMRGLEAVAALEQKLGKPVVCSNQALMYQALCLLGRDTPIAGFGYLLQKAARS